MPNSPTPLNGPSTDPTLPNLATKTAFAQYLDLHDPLAKFRDAFVIPEGGQTLYLCTNSLGLQPRCLTQTVGDILHKWGEQGVTSWFRDGQDQDGEDHPPAFATADQRVLEDLAAIVGAANKEEVVAMNSLTANIHLMLVAFYRPTKTRFKVIVEEGAFPSDMHVLKSHLAHVFRQQQQDHQHDIDIDIDHMILTIPRRSGEVTWCREDMLIFLREHGSEAALCWLSGLHYSTGQLFDIAAITQVAQAQGMLVGFDLAHAVGNVDLALHEWGVDFACWCHYKYLCSGPGAVGGCFVHEKHTNFVNDMSRPPLPRIAGWWGQQIQDRFTFAEPTFVPAPGALGFQLSTPSPLLLACLQTSLKIFREAGGMKPLRAKSILLTGYLQCLLEKLLPDQIKIVSPTSDANERGCQLSLTFTASVDVHAKEILKKLEAEHVMADVRAPNIIRVAPFPLYTRFQDVHRFVQILQKVLNE